MLEGKLADLVGRIYEAATGGEPWGAFLNDVAAQVPNGRATLYVLQETGYGDTPAFEAMGAASDWTDGFLDSYARHFWRTNPWTRPALRRQIGQLSITDDVVPRRTLETSEFFNDWLRPQGLAAGIGGTFARYGGFSAHFSLLHGSSRPDSRVETLCRALLPHLTRGAQIHQRLLDAAAQREALEGGFDHMSVGLILTDAAGRMLFANPSAEASLRAGGPLRLDRGGALGTGRADTTEVLRRLIAQAATVLDAPLARPGDGLTLEGGADGRQTSLLVVPASRNASVLSVGHPKVMIFVVTPAAAREPSAADLRQRYGLTAAEARIAGALATGASLKEIAGRHETVRLHLKHIFAKTGTHRQADLVRLLVRALPAAVDRGAIR